ncbi:hypothetical protein [Streptomyces sp. NPDC001165]|uniref:hypothetical protein n=1 Tax=Streptomyces sp. NPDC001165 TaxID=3364546 RepID=UPI0036BEEAB7
MHRTAAIVFVTAVCLAISACTTETPGAHTPVQRTDATASPGPEAKFTVGSGSSHGSAPVPDLAGQNLQAALDEARAAGFQSIRTYDVRSRGRKPFVARSWKVCTQVPGALGRASTDTAILLGVAKREESCFDDN